MAENTVFLKISGSQDSLDRDSLLLLYMPLMGQDGLVLYETLFSLARLQPENEEEEILQASGLGEGRMKKALGRLEMFGLVEVYENPVRSQILYSILCPLDPGSFLRHEIYSRLLLNAVGSARFDSLVFRFTKQESVPEGYLKKSTGMDASFLEDQWSGEKEEALQKLRPGRDISGFDWEKFYRGRDRELPQRMRTRENEELIASLAKLYGLSEEQIRVYVIRACPGPLRILDKEGLREIVRNERKARFLNHEDPFSASPVLFLQQRQNGAPVSMADRKLLERLQEDYRFSNEVINELLDYVMEQTGGALPASYTGKIAGTWARLSVDTRQKAREWRSHLKDSQRSGSGKSKSRGTGLPAWYSDYGQQGPTDDLMAEIERLRKNGDS